jgi:hypothetical protein
LNPWPDEIVARDPRINAPDVLTEHSVEVQEVLKLDRRMLPSLTELNVIQAVGSADWNGYHITTDGGFAAPFAVNEQYVLFLTWDSANERFWVAPFDAFQVVENGIIATGNARYQQGANNSDLQQFVAAIKAAVIRQ